jgi:hypothetical protein
MTAFQVEAAKSGEKGGAAMTRGLIAIRNHTQCRVPRALFLAITLALWANFCAPATGDVLERSYNPSRTGTNTAETVLTPDNVRSSANQFHKRFVMKVDGKIEGSPLYAAGVNIAGGTHNVLYVATMHNTVFAFDADAGTQLSARWLGNPVTGDDLHNLKPITIHNEWGIASTPVIDRATGTLYVVRWGYENGVSGPTFRLFGLDMSNLSNDKFGSVRIDGFNIGTTQFNRYRQMQRAALALTKNRQAGRLLSLLLVVEKVKGAHQGGWSRSTQQSLPVAAHQPMCGAAIPITPLGPAAVAGCGWQMPLPLSMPTATSTSLRAMARTTHSLVWTSLARASFV